MNKIASSRKERKQYRQLGINIQNCRQVVKQLREDGDVDMTDKVAVAAAVETELLLFRADDVGIDWDKIDWDKLFEFIMRIIQLIMSFFA